MADKCEVNGIARALSRSHIINYTGLSKSDSIIVHKAIEKLAKGEGNSERPDAIVAVDGIAIGIEHFKLYPETSRKGDKIEQLISKDKRSFAKNKPGLQIGPTRQYQGEKVIINGMTGYRPDYSSSEEKLERIFKSFDNVYSKHIVNIDEYRRNIETYGCATSKLVFLVECTNFELFSACGDLVNPYCLPGFRDIMMGYDRKPDYIAFYMRWFNHRVLCITDISADGSILRYSSNSAAGVMLYNHKACKLQFNVDISKDTK